MTPFSLFYFEKEEEKKNLLYDDFTFYFMWKIPVWRFIIVIFLPLRIYIFISEFNY